MKFKTIENIKIYLRMVGEFTAIFGIASIIINLAKGL